MKRQCTVEQLNEALEIAIQDILDATISSQDGDKGCGLCRLESSPICAAVTGEPTPTRCFNAIKKQLVKLGLRDSESKRRKR